MSSRVKLRIEKSRSRTGKHAFRALVLEVCDDTVREPKAVHRVRVRPTYAVGEAFEAEFESSCVLVYLSLVKNLRNEVKGVIRVFHEGKEVLRVKYIKEKIRRVCGDKSYHRVLEHVIRYLRIPYRRINMDTGDDVCERRV